MMPSRPSVLNQEGVEELFGHFDWRPNGERTIQILGDWVEENTTRVYIPELDGVATYGGKFSGQVHWHRKGVVQLQLAFKEIGEKDLQKDVIMWGGSFFPRKMTRSTVLSHHSWGIALDINPDQNGFGKRPAPVGVRGSVERLAPIFEKHGFCWGGRWQPSRADGMHFEIARMTDSPVIKPAPAALLVINDVWQEAIPITLQNGMAYASLKALEHVTGAAQDGIEERAVPVASYLRSKGYTVVWKGREKRIYAYST